MVCRDPKTECDDCGKVICLGNEDSLCTRYEEQFHFQRDRSTGIVVLCEECARIYDGS